MAQKRRRCWLGFWIGCVLAPCSWANELTVSAAASLTQAMTELAPAFESLHPGARVRLNFGASGALLQQIAKGAPVDVFASADAETMDQAQAQQLVRTAERRNFARNALVVIVPAGAAAAPRQLADLEGAAFRRIAIGQPASVPAGRYARAALQQAGLWATLEPRLIMAQQVTQARDYVARGEVDAGFVYATDAALMPDRVRVALQVASELPILYPIAVVRDSTEPELAARFVDFVQTPAAQTILAKFGFLRP